MRRVTSQRVHARVKEIDGRHKQEGRGARPSIGRHRGGPLLSLGRGVAAPVGLSTAAINLYLNLRLRAKWHDVRDDGSRDPAGHPCRRARPVRDGPAGIRRLSGLRPAGWDPPAEEFEEARITERLGLDDTWCRIAFDRRRAGRPRRVPGRPRAFRRPAADPGLAHLWMLFIREPWWGSGLAPRLMAMAVAEAAAPGLRRDAALHAGRPGPRAGVLRARGLRDRGRPALGVDARVRPGRVPSRALTCRDCGNKTPARSATAPAPLIDEAAERSRVSMRTRLERLRVSWRSILQVGIAAGVAWVIATEVFGHSQPFFAPVSAIITLGLTISQRGRRAVEVAIGVARRDRGRRPARARDRGRRRPAGARGDARDRDRDLPRLGQMLATQAAVSAALVATLQPPTEGVTFARFLDALAGGDGRAARQRAPAAGRSGPHHPRGRAPAARGAGGDARGHRGRDRQARPVARRRRASCARARSKS